MSLPLLTYTSNLFPNISLEKVLLVSCQHILATNVDMFEEFFLKGLKPGNTFLIGKCYSTNEETYRKLMDAKIHVSPLSRTFDSYVSFDEQFQNYIQDFFKDVMSKVDLNDFEKIIILDDGAHLLLYINDFVSYTEKIVGIEQTSSGYDRLKSVDLKFPVINVARSKAKLEIESPFIADLIFEKIELYLQNINLEEPKILVIGQGYIGNCITNLLKDKYEVNGCDIVNNKCDFGGDYKDQLHTFDIIIGATGQEVISEGDLGRLKKGVVLISASSSDREFSAVYLRRFSEQTNDCHKNFDVNGTRLLNGGFPINFTGGKYSLPPERSQFTRALLSAAIYQSPAENKKEFIELDINTQDKIIEEFSKLI